MRYKLQHLIVFATFACCLNTTAEHYPGASEAFDIDGVTQRLRAAEDRHQAFDHKFKEATGRQTALHGQHRQLEKQFAVSGQHLAQHTRQIEKDRAALRQADADIAVAQDQIAEAKRCVAAAAGEANNLRQRLQQAQARLDRKQHELAELEIECATFAGEIQHHCVDGHDHGDGHAVDCDRLQARLHTLEGKVGQVKAQINRINGRKAAIQDELNPIANAIAKYNGDLQKSEARRRERQRKVAALDRNITEAQGHVERVRRENKQVENEFRQLNIAIIDCDRMCRQFEQNCAEDTLVVNGLRHDLNRVRNNYTKALRHVERMADRHGREGAREGHDLAIWHAAEKAERLGEEIGRERGQSDGRERAELAGAIDGKKTGTEDGINDARQQAGDAAERDGSRTGLLARGYDEGVRIATADPDRGSRTYLDAYDAGNKYAVNEAKHTDYAFGSKQAETESYDAPLTRYQLDNAGARPFDKQAPARAVPAVANSAKPQRPTFDRTMPKLVDNRQRTIAAAQIKGHQAYSGTRAEYQDINTLNDGVADITVTVPLGRDQNWQCRYFDPKVMRYSYRPLQKRFEEVYRLAYVANAAQAYDETYDKTFQDVLQVVAAEAYIEFSEADRYIADHARHRDDAFEYWRTRSWNETYAAEYTKLHQQFRDQAYRAPDMQAAQYRDGYQQGVTVAHQQIGFKRGYNENIGDARQTQFDLGYDERTKSFQNNAVFENTEITLVDANNDHVFAIGETFSAAIELRNYGKISQAPKSLGVVTRIVSGPAAATVGSNAIVPVPGQSLSTIKNITRGLIDVKARTMDKISVEVTVYHHSDVLARKQFDITVRYPMSIDDFTAPVRMYTNSAGNVVSGTLTNRSQGNPPGPVRLELLANGKYTGDALQVTEIPPGATASFDFTYQPTPEQLLAPVDFAVRAVAADIEQAASGRARSFISRKASGDATVFLSVHDLSTMDAKPILLAYERLGVTVDLFERSVDGNLDSDLLAGYEFAVINNDIDLSTRAGLQRIIERGGHIVIAGRLSNDPASLSILESQRIEIKGFADGGVLQAKHCLDGQIMSSQYGKLPKLRTPTRSKTHKYYTMLEGPDVAIFSGRPAVAVRSVAVENGSTLSVIGFGLDTVAPDAAADLLARVFMMSRPVSATIDAKLQGTMPKGAARAVLQSRIAEEIDRNKAHKGKLYNAKYNDVERTDIYIFQQAVLTNPQNPACRELLSLAPAFNKRIHSRSSRKLIAPLMAAYKRLK
jgi:predicted  nucleic acid-binding Zn-ribbon protein